MSMYYKRRWVAWDRDMTLDGAVPRRESDGHPDPDTSNLWANCWQSDITSADVDSLAETVCFDQVLLTQTRLRRDRLGDRQLSAYDSMTTGTQVNVDYSRRYSEEMSKQVR
jgi:hypothetical protein